MSTSKIGRLYRAGVDARSDVSKTLGLPVVDESLWWALGADAPSDWGPPAHGQVALVPPTADSGPRVDLTALIDKLEEALRRVRQELRKRDLPPVSREQLNVVAGRLKQQLARAKLALEAHVLQSARDEIEQTLEATDLTAERRGELEQDLAQLAVDLHQAEADVRIFDLQCKLDDLEREAAKPGASRKDFEDRINTCLALLKQVEEDKERGPSVAAEEPSPRNGKLEEPADNLQQELKARLQVERTRLGDPFGR